MPYDFGTGIELEDLNLPVVGLASTDGTFLDWAGPYLESNILTDPWGTGYWFDQDYYVDGVKVVVIGSYGPNGVGKNKYDADDVYMILYPISN